jgi:hypothetical protein
MSKKHEEIEEAKSVAVIVFIDDAVEARVITKELGDKLADWYAGADAPEDPYDKALPSRYKHNEEVRHVLLDPAKIHSTKVIKIAFTESSVFYDLEVEWYREPGQTPKNLEDKDKPYHYSRLYNVASSDIAPVNK